MTLRADAFWMAVRLRRLLTAEGALILGGIGIAVAGAAIDVWATAAALSAADHSGHDALLGLNLPVVGFAFIAFGLFMAQSGVFLHRGSRRVFLAALLLIADGLVHLSVIAPHVHDGLHHAAFFGAVAAVQVVAGLTLPESSRRLRDLWLLLSLFLIGLYVASRAVEVPYLFGAEPIEAVGVFSKFLEGLLVIVLLTMRTSAFEKRMRLIPAEAEADRGTFGASR